MSYNAFERWAIQPDQTPELSVVIPTYNEAERILPTLWQSRSADSTRPGN
jgi:dolichyl-phosphate beta-glucosyltransferase